MFGRGGIVQSVTRRSEADKQLILDFAVTAMEELIPMAQLNEPLWIQDFNSSTEILNEIEYLRLFPGGVGPKPPGLTSEASRHTAVVVMNQANLVETLMDVNQWCTMFSSIVSRAVTLETYSTGVAGNYDGSFQVMSAEFQVPTPLVPIRESLFVRYCKQQQDAMWAVVDFPLDDLRPGPTVQCRRRPSGCLIQEMPNGCSKVTWVEHVEADHWDVHDLYKPLVNSGLAFSAKRWVSTLERQCERLASVMSSNYPSGSTGIITPEGKKSLLKLADRMLANFCGNVTASPTHQWTTLSSRGDEVCVMVRQIVSNAGGILVVAASLWLPIQPKRVFDYLRDGSTRTETQNAIGNQNNNLILQECCTDRTGSYVIYAPVNVVSMNLILTGGDPNYVVIMPSGFAILPGGPQSRSEELNPQNEATPNEQGHVSESDNNGSLMTEAFQMHVPSMPNSPLSLISTETVNNLIAMTVGKIKAALSSGNRAP
ncbi:Homeobox-leucine zipper protein ANTHOCYANINLESS 2 [Rhynchospora pubera]|uniref:Homeobox-leucine zipper protein ANTHOCYANINLESS 2 n=1 Tax=Rhynchospora pubera TaxID=906938 RepID=A0AAV8EGT2_9POAL|nr:Homeobox-leucine zipper protein ANTHOCYANINLESS 2 [Rhynchospora pubera]